MVRIGLRGGVVGAIVLAAGCSTGAPPSPVSTGAPSEQPAAPVPDVSTIDHDRNRIDDMFDAQATQADSTDEEVAFEAVFSRPMPALATAELARVGGRLRHIYRAVSYGFSGYVPRSQLSTLASTLGPDLLLLKAERPLEQHLDEATKGARVRAVWAPGFAGSTSGFTGSSKVNIAIVDGGVDPTHPDLAGRMIGWKDYTFEAKGTASDSLGHGTHVAGIAVGSGASFGVGPGTLSWTDSGDNSAEPSNGWVGNAIHFPPAFTLTSTATFLGGGTTTMSLLRGDEGKTTYTSLTTTAPSTSPLSFTFEGTAAAGTHFTMGLRQNAAKDVGNFAVANKLTNYPAVGDGFPVMRGAAPGSGWFAAKIFPVNGTATSADIGEALDDIAEIAKSLDIKVVNCSFGISGGGTEPTQRSKANALVDRGIVVVSSSGNNVATGATGDPGRASKVITVGAVNDINQVTSYSSGSAATAADTDEKPDIVAPGGSSYRSKILSVDTNGAEAANPAFPDVQANDYTSILGTSMAAPMVAGAAALVIQALESKGYVWEWGTKDVASKSPMLVKMLLTASATETNALRESNSNNPVVGRAGAPKDRMEGYGILNPDAAIEAATMTWDFVQPLSGTSDGTPSAKRAWGRKITVPAGHTLKLGLTQAAESDYDIYVYKSTPSAKGTPQLNAWSDSSTIGGTELTTWKFADQTDLYVFVKRIAGTGAFTLTGSTFTCGNGVIEPGEECDDSNAASGDCCSAACQLESAACGSDAGSLPQGNVDAGTGDAGDAGDAGPPDAAVAPPEDAAPPFTDPEPNPTGPPSTSASSSSGAPIVAPEVEPLTPGGGGCATTTHGTSGFGAGLGIVVAWALASRRRRRA